MQQVKLEAPVKRERLTISLHIPSVDILYIGLPNAVTSTYQEYGKSVRSRKGLATDGLAGGDD